LKALYHNKDALIAKKIAQSRFNEVNTMVSEANPKARQYLKGILKKAKEAFNLVIGNSEALLEEDNGGDLEFDPAVMMKINVTLDKEFLPKEKVVKLNVRGNQFFRNIKRNIREVNSIYIVYPQEYEVQLDVRRDEWEKRLMAELNEEYQLSLEKIHFVSEEEVCRRYRRKGIKIRDSYHLNQGELLIIAGGFVNFDFQGMPLCNVRVTIAKDSQEENKKPGKKSYRGDYFGKHSPRAGAYFFVGGAWYHNLFVPELYKPGESRFFSFRISGDGKRLKFFSDQKVRGVDIRSGVKTRTEPGCERIIYTINPEYLQGSGINDFKLSILYDIKESEPSAEVSLPLNEIKAAPQNRTPEIHLRTFEKKPAASDENIDAQRSNKAGAVEEDADENVLPYLESQLILLPGPQNDDVSSYMMTIGDEKKNVTFYANSIDNEVSILAPGKEEKIYKRKIGDRIDYSIKLGRIAYSISNLFLSRIDHRILKLYFAWELKTNVVERIHLEEDFYIMGRESRDDPGQQALEQTPARLIRLSKGEDDFWRIGTSRDHAFLVKESSAGSYQYHIFNISLSYPIYLLKTGSHEDSPVSPSILDPVPGKEKQEKCMAFLANVKEAVAAAQAEPLAVPRLLGQLRQFANGAPLENNELLIVGNRVFKYLVPMVMESPLNDRIQKSILRKIQLSESVLRE
jgi:hypothetical protein